MSKTGKIEKLEPEEDQHKLLDEAKKKVKVEAFYMKRCLDHGKVIDAISHASTMICQLRTGNLTPQNYYDLYISTLEQLRHFESYLWDNYGQEKNKEKTLKLYETVQYAGNILPRMYLLITVGSIYIKSKEGPAKDVLRDLVEMCRGVQHPTRGLFLRSYLSDLTKDKLPDTGSDYEGKGGTVKDSVDFVLQNFTEMNKLWVRMQPKGNVRDKEKREVERRQLCLLVGKNLAILSNLEGVNNQFYSSTVLPRIVEQIINCKDQIAQQYLMECVIQVFPDDFHLLTLEKILSSCTMLQPSVNVKSIVVSLVDRLANYSAQSPELIPKFLDVFSILFSSTVKIIEQRPKLTVEEVLELLSSLLNFTLRCYPTQYQNADNLFTYAHNLLDHLKQEKGETAFHTAKASLTLSKLLTAPLDTYKNALQALSFASYSALLSFLDADNRRNIAITLLKNVLENETVISTPQQVDSLLDFVSVLLTDSSEEEKLFAAKETKEVENWPPGSREEFFEIQDLIASVVHLFNNKDEEVAFQLLLSARNHFAPDNTVRKERIQRTLIPLIFKCFPVINRFLAKANQQQQDEDEDEDEDSGGNQLKQELIKKAKRVFKFSLDTISFLASKKLSQMSLRLFLQAAQSANTAKFEAITYEFLTRAFLIYEEDITDSKTQLNSIILIAGTIQTINCLSEENYDTVITKCAQLSAKLLKKPDQCLAVSKCSHLFWKDEFKEGKRVLECLQRCLKIAEFATGDSSKNIDLFVGILDEYNYYYANNNENIVVDYLNSLIALINSKREEISSSISFQPDAEAKMLINSSFEVHLRNTLAHLKARKQQDSRYERVDL